MMFDGMRWLIPIRSIDNITGHLSVDFYSIWNDGLVGICWRYRVSTEGRLRAIQSLIFEPFWFTSNRKNMLRILTQQVALKRGAGHLKREIAGLSLKSMMQFRLLRLLF